MSKDTFPQSTPQLAEMRKKLAPDVHEAFVNLSERVFAEGALPTKTKQLIAVAAAHITFLTYSLPSRKASRRLAETASAAPTPAPS